MTACDGRPRPPLQSLLTARFCEPVTQPLTQTNPLTFQELILRLQAFWAERGCVLQQPYDVEVGAGTMAPGDVSCACWARNPTK